MRPLVKFRRIVRGIVQSLFVSSTPCPDRRDSVELFTESSIGASLADREASATAGLCLPCKSVLSLPHFRCALPLSDTSKLLDSIMQVHLVLIGLPHPGSIILCFQIMLVT